MALNASCDAPPLRLLHGRLRQVLGALHVEVRCSQGEQHLVVGARGPKLLGAIAPGGVPEGHRHSGVIVQAAARAGGPVPHYHRRRVDGLSPHTNGRPVHGAGGQSLPSSGKASCKPAKTIEPKQLRTIRLICRVWAHVLIALEKLRLSMRGATIE